VGTLIHAVISAGLFISAFAIGMASFTSGSGGGSRLLFRALTVWNFPYEYVWAPTASRVLPAVPSAKPMPKSGDTKEWGLYEAHMKETNRIAGIHTATRNLGYVFSALLGGCMLSSVYILLRKQNEKSA